MSVSFGASASVTFASAKKTPSAVSALSVTGDGLL
jgi:hypothetical protein